ncbi:MAG: dienelactone hydrolase family protein [Leptolyngbyaceae cyanobacterium MO_188.B28]|nr:dienelactone hydrolase family protein [Leptolyngbyaceae cyanobacterium MO_188.B28]
MRTLRESDNASLVSVTADSATLYGSLVIPAEAQGIVLFAHGSGSSRRSSRNRYVAHVLNNAGLATLLIDLLTSNEEILDRHTQHLRFDIGLLSSRLVGATDWLRQNPSTRFLNIGYFGASTGSAAALIAATERSDAVDAIVSRGGRPDLAGTALVRVQAPTLLILGGKDHIVIKLNRDAFEKIVAEKQLEIVPGATHLFEESGALEQVAQLASQWFQRHLNSNPDRLRREEG